MTVLSCGDSPVVRVEDVTSGFDGIPVLNGVSMVAERGKITLILGSSGCGKTTLLKHLIRLYSPWSGSIKLFDREITHMDEPEFNTLLRRVGVLFQNGALLNSITITENTAIPLKQHTDLSLPLIYRMVRMKLDLMGLGHACDKLPSELSGGMRKRAALARAMIMDPELLFCDEPTAGLDPTMAASLDDLILGLRDRFGTTMVVVSHEVPSILRIADCVVFMDQGRVLFQGPLAGARQAGIAKIDEFFEKGSTP